MSKVTIELDSAGIRELLKSSEIASVCEKEAVQMTKATGVDYVPDIYVGKTRVNVSAYQKTGGDNE